MILKTHLVPGWVLFLSPLLGMLAAALVVFVLLRNSQLANENHRAVVALCYERGDLDNRIGRESRALVRSRHYLRTHPNGAPGIPKLLIEQSIADNAQALRDSKKTRKNLDVLDC